MAISKRKYRKIKDEKTNGVSGDAKLKDNKQKTIESYFTKIPKVKAEQYSEVEIDSDMRRSSRFKEREVAAKYNDGDSGRRMSGRIKEKVEAENQKAKSNILKNGVKSNGNAKKIKSEAKETKVKFEAKETKVKHEEEQTEITQAKPKASFAEVLESLPQPDFKYEDSNVVSNYELEREANINQNLLMLAELTGNSAMPLKSSLLKPVKPKKVQKTREKRVSRPEQNIERRTSRRLQGLEASKVDYNLVKLHNLDIPLHKYGTDKELAAEKEVKVERPKIKVDDRFYPASSFQLVIDKLAVKDSNTEAKSDYDLEPLSPNLSLEEVKAATQNKIHKLEPRYPDHIKCTQERIYSIQFHPSMVQPLLFVGSKVGELTLLDVSQPFDVEKMSYDYDCLTTKLRPHSMAVTGIRVSQLDETKVLTCSHDKSVRQLDLTQQTVTTLTASSSDMFSHLDIFSDNPHQIVCSSLQGKLSVFDIRSGTNCVLSWYNNPKHVKVGTVAINPTHPHVLATASLDRTLKLWDLRNLPKATAEPVPYDENKYLQSIPYDLSVSSAFWSSCGTALVSTTYEHKLKVYDFKDNQLEFNRQFHHNCRTGMYTSNFMAKFHPDPHWGKNLVVCADMGRSIHFYSTLDTTKGLGGPLAKVQDKELFTAIPATLTYHPKANLNSNGPNLLATANSSGNVVVLQ